MRHLLLLFAATLVFASARAENAAEGFVLVEGGPIKHPKSNFYAQNVTVADFYIGKFEVTQKEWVDVMGSNPSQFLGDNLPVDNVSWYDSVEYCNKRSVKEGLQPYYTIDKEKKDPANDNELDDQKWTVTINADANGYRLPTEAEWEYAAAGGRLSKQFTYSGGHEVDKVAWYYKNSGDEILHGLWNWPMLEKNNNKSKPVGGKAANELGIHDMSGNVREWCWDWFRNLDGTRTNGDVSPMGAARVWKGGGWIGADFCCEPVFRAGFEANGRGPDQGLRLCRDK